MGADGYTRYVCANLQAGKLLTFTMVLLCQSIISQLSGGCYAKNRNTLGGPPRGFPGIFPPFLHMLCIIIIVL